MGLETFWDKGREMAGPVFMALSVPSVCFSRFSHRRFLGHLRIHLDAMVKTLDLCEKICFMFVADCNWLLIGYKYLLARIE